MKAFMFTAALLFALPIFAGDTQFAAQPAAHAFAAGSKLRRVGLSMEWPAMGEARTSNAEDHRHQASPGLCGPGE